MLIRPRRNRVSPAIRSLVRETDLTPRNLVLPVFLQVGDADTPIASMPGVARQCQASVLATAGRALDLGVQALALFEVVPEARKDRQASASADADGLLARTVRALKSAHPGLVVITDVALDPYSSDGHDGLVRDGRIVNDETLPLLCAQAVMQAGAGADVIAPSDMMDGRVGAIRHALDAAGYTDVLICSYCTKYASAFYGPFRDALDSAPRFGDKKTYQMDPANRREVEREVALDEAEGADWLMVKPGLPYLDVLHRVRALSALPVNVYQVSGEYAMMKAAAERGWLDWHRCLLESLTSFRRAGADLIWTYAALDAAEHLKLR